MMSIVAGHTCSSSSSSTLSVQGVGFIHLAISWKSSDQCILLNKEQPLFACS